MVVLEITKKGSNIIVQLSNNDELIIPYDVYLKNYFSKNDKLSSEQKKSIEKDSMIYLIKQSSFRYLSGRNHSKYELKLKLRKKKYDYALIDKVLGDLEKENFLNDEQFASDFFNSQVRKKKGLLQIKANLGKKGIDREIIDTVTNKLNDDSKFFTSASQIAEKKINLLRKRNFANSIIKRKLFQYLGARGFTTDIIMQTINQFELENNDE